MYVDGVRLMESDDWRKTVPKNVQAGPGSVFAVTACNVGGGGEDDQAYAKVDIHFMDNVLISDGSWKATDARPPGTTHLVWTAPRFDDSEWPNATEPELRGRVAPGLGPPRAKGIWTARKGPAQRVYLRSPPLPVGFCGPDPEPDGNRGQPGATAAPGRRDNDSGSGGVPVWGIVVAAVGGLTVAALALLGAVYFWCWPWGGGVYRVDEWHLFPPTTEGAAALDEEEARRVGASGGGLSAAEALAGVGGGGGGSAAATADAASFPAALRARAPAGASESGLGDSDDGGAGGDGGYSSAGGGKPGLMGAAAKPPVDYSYALCQSSTVGGSGTNTTNPVSADAADGGSFASIPRPPTDGSRAPWFNG